MRLLNETIYGNIPDAPMTKTFLHTLKKECSDILDVYMKKNMFLYRGAEMVVNDTVPVQIKPTKNRAPLNTAPADQIFIDDIFYKKFGWRPRSEGVFATANFSEATVYGDVYWFFPANGYRFVWSPRITDLFSDVLWMNTAQRQQYSNRYDPKKGRGIWKRGSMSIDDITKLDGYIRHNIKINTSSIGFDKVVRHNWQAYVEIENEDVQLWNWIPKISIEDYRKIYITNKLETYIDTNIERAMTSNNEITFKCKYYYVHSPVAGLKPREVFGGM